MNIKNRFRKEIVLDAQTIAMLSFKAEKEGRNLKNYIEHILKEKAENLVLSESYKENINSWLEKEKEGKVNFISKEIFLKRINEI